ncbi:MAG: Asp-tRNA(Asn)/Glu-tRNA(Gln) amidotransferase subunit GatA [Patescibacteria group bacterium]|nr:Asp-tRNA(Asn)/Glu-tRNA(Gln) amidotransferase subunit GatA [Patescibacteria group bacterium]
MNSNLTIKDIHNKLVQKEISCVDLVKYYLKRIKDYNKKLNVFLAVCEEDALRQAKEIDEKISKGKNIGILEGIVFSVKDTIMTKGLKTTAGSEMLFNFIPCFDATSVKKLRNAGAILIGKTNCDSFGHGSSGENSDYGSTKNPWNTSCVPGGSSSGAAVSVAMDMASFALGEDTGGSIRCPASFCGVNGLKVSYGRVSRYGVIAYASSFDTVGPMAKHIDDLAIILSIISGKDEKDATTVFEKVPDYEKEILGSIKSKKIGIPKEYFSSALDSKVKEILDNAIKKFIELGCKIEKINLPYTEYAVPAYYILTSSETSSNLSRLDGLRYGLSVKSETLQEKYQNSRAKGFNTETKRRIAMGTYSLSAGYYDAYYKKAQKVRTLIKEDFKKAFKKVDYILTPTMPFPAFKIGKKLKDPLSMYLSDIFTVPFSLAGIPSISIPGGFANKMPVGIQLSAPYLKENEILKLAYCFEKATNFHKYRPKI